MKSEKLARKISELALEKKGRDIVIMDLRRLTDITDFFVLMSGESDIHVKALTDYIEEKLARENIRPWHREGYEVLNWVLLDFVDVVVHIFRPQTREYYSLEKLWADAPQERVVEE